MIEVGQFRVSKSSPENNLLRRSRQVMSGLIGIVLHAVGENVPYLSERRAEVPYVLNRLL
jgi:hypothetical protein